MQDSATLLKIQFLSWLAARPRSYGEVKGAWRSTCPRLTAWEDALDEGLIRLDGARAGDAAQVTLTPAGRALLDSVP
jgi:hypothetical protein